MNFYLDTSFLVSCVAPEATSAVSLRWLDIQGSRRWVISEWVVTELHSALYMKTRTGELSEQGRDAALHFFLTTLLPKVVCLEVSRSDFELARTYFDISGHNLRAADALHLAVASRNDLSLVSYDKRMNHAAGVIGSPRISTPLSQPSSRSS